jgi:hypothetical protein
MALPECRHLYLDNAWKDLGEAAGCLHYRPDVVVEHCHPWYGKGDHDVGYARVNSLEQYASDRAGYERWKTDRLASDANVIRRAIGAGAPPLPV